MPQIYPKRLINFISISLLIVCLLGLIRESSGYYENYSNLTSTDKSTSIIVITFIVFTIISSIAVLSKKKWAWIGITSYLIYSIGIFIVDSNKFSFSHPLFIVIPIFIIVFIPTIFLFSKPVIKYFNLKWNHVLLVLALSISIYNLVALNPLKNFDRVNSHYIDLKEDKFYLFDSLFNGTLFTNYPNGMIKFEGVVKDGLAEGEWKFYYIKGEIESISNYKNGLIEGKEISYFSTGETKEVKNFQDGELQGEYKFWFSPNELEIIGKYSSGLKHGEWRKYDNESDVVKIENYNYDTLLNEYYLDN